MTDKNELSGSNAEPLISRIQVEQLYNTYSYSLEPTPTNDSESSKLMLLYGNNGSGKTTILNLLYHLLHPEPAGGHRSFVGQIPFKLFRAHLFEGITITAERNIKNDPVSYDLHVEYPRLDITIDWRWQPKTSQHKDKGELQYKQYCSFLSELGLSFHYLLDTRRVEGSKIKRGHVSQHMAHDFDEDFIVRMEEERGSLNPDNLLTKSVDDAIQWFRQRALSATNVGYTSVNTIYKDIINRIAHTGMSQQEESHATISKLTEELINLRNKNSDFSRFGLSPELDIEEILGNLKMVQSPNFAMLENVLAPYLEGHLARLDALEELKRIMSSFASILSDFYSHKNASIHIENGLKIATDLGQELQPTMLSSGEKQLLLLFCNAISSRQNRTILIIDEPEISLNVRWQRDLIPALLECMSGTAFQLILATHSVELLARYRDRVTPLVDIKKGNIK
jgi:energy-coupling factor transporter ATP-binding protein EcfA2